VTFDVDTVTVVDLQPLVHGLVFMANGFCRVWGNIQYDCQVDNLNFAFWTANREWIGRFILYFGGIVAFATNIVRQFAFPEWGIIHCESSRSCCYV
jgi:hypothetical protein